MLVSSAADFLGEVTVGKALRDIPEKGAAEETYNMLDSISSPFINYAIVSFPPKHMIKLISKDWKKHVCA